MCYLESSSFVTQPYRRSWLQGYYNQMSKDNLVCLWDDRVSRVLQEQGFRPAEAPRSVYKVEKLYEALRKYEPGNAPRINFCSQHYKNGAALAWKCFAKPKDAKPLEISEFCPEFIESITSNPKGSSGLTAYGTKKYLAVDKAFIKAKQIMLNQSAPEPCIAFKRTQFNDKTRLVWGYPYSMTALEGIVARPLIDKFKGGSTPMAFAMPDALLGTKLIVASNRRKWAYSTDVSSYDSSVPAALIRQAFAILGTWFDMNQEIMGLDCTIGKLWDKIQHYFIHTPIVMPDGYLYKGKKHGVPSGSYFTQLVDSVCNTIIVGTIDSYFHLGIDPRDIFVLGDDILFWSDKDYALKSLTEFATNFFGMKFNTEKSMKARYDEVVHFLGRDWKKGVPYLNMEDILKRMVQPESYRKYSEDDQVADRQVRLLIMSYATQYYNAWDIVWKVFNGKPSWQTIDAMERWIMRRGSIPMEVMDQLDPNFLSGLARFRMKYIYPDLKMDTIPVAMQFLA